MQKTTGILSLIFAIATLAIAVPPLLFILAILLGLEDWSSVFLGVLMAVWAVVHVKAGWTLLRNNGEGPRLKSNTILLLLGASPALGLFVFLNVQVFVESAAMLAYILASVQLVVSFVFLHAVGRGPVSKTSQPSI